MGLCQAIYLISWLKQQEPKWTKKNLWTIPLYSTIRCLSACFIWNIYASTHSRRSLNASKTMKVLRLKPIFFSHENWILLLWKWIWFLMTSVFLMTIVAFFTKATRPRQLTESTRAWMDSNKHLKLNNQFISFIQF